MDWDSYERAKRKAEDPNMTLAGNPLVEGRDEYLRQKNIRRNMNRLMHDADARDGIHGRVYAGIMSTRYKGD